MVLGCLGSVAPRESRHGHDDDERGDAALRFTVNSHLTLHGVVQSNGKPEPELNDGFEQGGWQVSHLDEDMDRLTADWSAQADAPTHHPMTRARSAGGVR
jgi:hypothetical protein